MEAQETGWLCVKISCHFFIGEAKSGVTSYMSARKQMTFFLVFLTSIFSAGILYPRVASADTPVVSATPAQAFPTPSSSVTNTNMATVANAASQKMRLYAIWLSDIVGPHADSVFLAIVWYVIVAKIVLMSFKIMIGGNLIEELTQFLISAVILLLLFFQIPQGAIARLKDSFEQAGRALGVTIVEGTKTVRNQINSSTGALPEQISSSGVTSVEPLSYWMDWIGEPGAGNTQTEHFKYDSNYIIQMIFRVNPNDARLAKSTQDNRNAGTPPAPGTSTVQTIAAWITAMNPFMVFNYALITAQIELAGYAAITFSQLAILFGAHIGFALLYTFGLSLMPLIFFKTYFNLWAHYLTTLIGFALVPGFFYIFAGVGYGFSTTTFEILFLNNKAPLGAYMWQVFAASFNQAAVSFERGAFGIGVLGAQSAFDVLQWTLSTGVMHMMGAGLVTGFLAMGTGFAALAPAVASKWNSGFIDMGILDTTNNTIRSVESTLGSTLGQGMAMGARNITGAARGLTGGLGSMTGIGG
jgi:hypothetical protein